MVGGIGEGNDPLTDWICHAPFPLLQAALPVDLLARLSSGNDVLDFREKFFSGASDILELDCAAGHSMRSVVANLSSPIHLRNSGWI